MAAADYVWPTPDLWPDWTGWSTLTTAPDVAAGHTGRITADNRRVPVRADDRRVPARLDDRTVKVRP